MKEHYEAVLRDMEEQEQRLESQLQRIRTARPAILALMEDATPKPIHAPSLVAPPKYAAMGLREAVLDFLGGQDQTVEAEKIAEALEKGGLKTASADFSGVVKSTLNNLKKMGKVQRMEDGWRISPPDSPGDWHSIERQPPSLQ